jgi:N12 class adenine-specific DNA methylase
MPSTHEHIIRWLIPVRDALREVLELQVADLPWATAQEALQKAYSDFVRMTGAPINDTRIVESLDPATGQMRERERRPVLEAFRSDPDAWLIFSIENHDPQSNKATRGPVFEKRVIGGKAESVVIGDAIDALPITLRDRGRLDLAHLAAACGLTETEAAAQLGDRAYIDPEDMTWTTADEYLSGPVRHKLAMAEAAAKQDPRFERNVEALRGVQPRALTPSEISIDLGAAWIPTDVIEDFSAEVIGVRAKVTHASVIGAWSVDQRPYHQHAPSATTWGTHRLHAGDLLDDCLNSRTPTVKDKETDAEGREREVINQAETEAARAKEQQLRRAFQEWVWKANERALRLVDIYNSKYNDLAPRMFDGSHLTLDDSNLAIRFHGNQKRGIWRIVAAGDTYLAHWMGSGKTYILIGAIMEQKRLGLVRKPLLVVPNHVLEQFAVAFLNLYPRARILVANEDDMSRRNRQQFLGKATTQEWDCVIVSHSAFGFIPVSAACEAEVLEELRDSYIAVLTAEADDSSITRKRLERAKERISQRIEQLRGRKDTMVTIAEMGIDQILVDEAQDFRKLSFATNRKNIKGIDPDGSQRAWDLYVKSHHMRKINPGRGLVLASGTPITNTMGELFTIQRYMDPKALEMRGLQTFDAWAATFGRMRTELELQPNGRYKRVERFAEFVNIPELYAMFAQFADVVTEDELRRYVQLPRLRTGSRQIMTCEPTDGFKRGQARLAEDIVAIERRTGLPKAGEKIILTVIGDGRLLAIDPRTLDESEPNDQATKLNVLIDNVYETWKSTRDRVYMDPATDEQMPLRGASQMIFSDIAITPSERRGSFSAYEWIRSRLIERGVPRSDIVVMQEHKKLSARRAVFEGMNHGRIAITIGSSGTMGTGANGHVRLIALHHLDQPYLVSAVSQREARMIRQGNQNEEVDLVAYVTAGSMDATMWQLLKRKAGFINNFLCGDTTVRRMEEEDEQVAGFAYARAMASGDQRLERKAGLESDIGRLERLRRAHYDGQHAARVELRHARSELEHASAMLAGEQADIAQRVDTTADAFRMTVGKIEHLSRKDANDAIRDAISSANKRRTVGDWTIGTIGGFNIVAHGSWQHVLQGERMAQAHRVEICVQRNAYKHDVKLGDGNPVARLENVLRSIGDKVPHYERQIGLLQRRIADYEASQGAPYEFEAELARLQAENDALEAELAADGHDAPAGATIEDEASETTAETAHATDAFEDRDKNEPAASQAIAERIPPTAQRAALNA